MFKLIPQEVLEVDLVDAVVKRFPSRFWGVVSDASLRRLI